MDLSRGSPPPPHSYLNLVEPPVEVPSPHLSRQYELYRHLGFIPTCTGHDSPTTPLRRRPPRRLASSSNKSTVPAPAQAPQAICLPNTGVDVQNDRRRSLPDPKTSRAARVPTHVHQESAICLIPGMKKIFDNPQTIGPYPIDLYMKFLTEKKDIRHPFNIQPSRKNKSILQPGNFPKAVHRYQRPRPRNGRQQPDFRTRIPRSCPDALPTQRVQGLR